MNYYESSKIVANNTIFSTLSIRIMYILSCTQKIENQYDRRVNLQNNYGDDNNFSLQSSIEKENER